MSESNYWNRAITQRLSRRQMLRSAAVGGAGLAGAALIGCGGSDAKDTTSNKPAAPGTGAGPAAVAVKPGGRLNLTQAGEPPSFDLHRESTTYTNYVTSHRAGRSLPTA